MNNKERLKDIKNARYFFHDVQDSDLLKDWNWLIEQAEKVQELQEENKRLREALEFYADEISWELEDFYEPKSSIAWKDNGQKARQALEEV